jgi:hypothetical protein
MPRPSISLFPDYERILRQQARATRAWHEANRRAVLAGGPARGEILERMRVEPERFLAGFDVEDAIVAGDASWDVAVGFCNDFLAELDAAADRTLISRTNAEGILWPAPI